MLDTIVLVDTSIRPVLVETERAMLMTLDACDVHVCIPLNGLCLTCVGMDGSCYKFVACYRICEKSN